ncbi:MAG: hypothetical protein ABI461_08220, partial [Polyangiaceae bacterium]
ADGGEHPDTSIGLFVYGDIGVDTSNCGNEATPCKTIGFGLGKAKGTSGKTTVYVAVSTKSPYAETITLAPGITIEGGWTVTGAGDNAEWDRVCKLDDPTQLARIVGTEIVTIHADDLGGEATLRYLGISTKDAGSGESVYGLFVSGSSKVTLDNVLISAGPGGDGTPGATGSPGAPGVVIPGGCMPGTPTTPAGGDAGVGATLATLESTGVSTELGTNGSPGSSGGNGPVGSDGGCTSCLTCAIAVGACAGAAPSCGASGSAGCGGSGGGPGGAGQSGGSAIGIYAWGGSVVATAGKIEIGGGGRGGAGGNGGSGGEGGVGPTGASGPKCSTSCATLGVACTDTSTGSGDGGGGIGSRGGTGSTGGMGGGGAGGLSYGVVSGLDASVTIPANTIAVKSGGQGGATGGPSGVSGERFP